MEHIPHAGHVLAASFIQFTLDKFAQLKEVFGTGSGIAAMAVILIAYLKYRTAKALVVAGILGGLAAWLVNNVVWVQQRVDEETNSMAPIERLVDIPPHNLELDPDLHLAGWS
ncbi:MAG: hypothetical protein IT198_17280 [Acidimicrobiia bacterium]|nr:hypothetical protein [Acidimicrobiia bacterium]